VPHAEGRAVTAPGGPVVGNLLELVGATPLVRLRQVPAADGAEVWGKCEHLNPGGSVKDRIARALLDAAEADGRIAPGRTTIVEPTSGNTGIALALACRTRGYRLVLTMPASMSLERRALLTSLGAVLELTPAERDMDGAVARARERVAATPDAWMPDQFRNPANPEAHRRTTAEELWAQLDGRVDAFVAGVGTGGTITGVGRLLRERAPAARVIAVEPAASRVLSGGAPGLHRIQGIGAGFVPATLDRAVIDEVRAVDDVTAWQTAKALARTEGLLVGISAGANVAVACQVARELGPGRRVATILCDTGERYFSLESAFA
jgi:cysteine synthase A